MECEGRFGTEPLPVRARGIWVKTALRREAFYLVNQGALYCPRIRLVGRDRRAAAGREHGRFGAAARSRRERPHPVKGGAFHIVMVSHPLVVANLIERAAAETAK